MKWWTTPFVVSAVLGVVALLPSCTTSSFCFRDCGGEGGSAASTGGGKDGGGGSINVGGSGGGINLDSGNDTSTCVANPPEICNGVDDDCNGKIDDGIDWAAPEHCGTCATHCTQIPHAVNAKCAP